MAKVKKAEKITMTVKGITVTGEKVGDGVRVPKGTRAVAEATSVSPAFQSARNARQRLVDEGVLVMDGDFLVFAKSYEFTSLTTAARVVSGTVIDGTVTWRPKK